MNFAFFGAWTSLSTQMTQPEKQEAPTGPGRGQTIFLSHFKRDSELNKNSYSILDHQTRQ